MGDSLRLANLRAAAFRARQQSQCRICKGNAGDNNPYCLRHYRMIGNNQLQKDVLAGERYDEADAFILLKQQFKGVRWIGDSHVKIGRFLSVRKSGHARWVVKLSMPAGNEDEVFEATTVQELMEQFIEKRRILTTHNHYATKMLIR